MTPGAVNLTRMFDYLNTNYQHMSCLLVRAASATQAQSIGWTSGLHKNRMTPSAKKSRGGDGG